MKSKIAAAVTVAVLAALLAVPATPAGAAKAPKTTVVATDAKDDWGCNVECSLSPLGNGLGQELVSAGFSMKDKKTLNFVFGLNSLPPSGGVPELTRYAWEFTVNGKPMQLSGGFTEYIRGTCNPTYNPAVCPPPRDPGQAPFFVREGECTLGAGGVAPCREVVKVNATFEPGSATVTVPVPLKALKAKAGSVIGPGTNASFGSTIYSAPQAFVSLSAGPADTLNVTKNYTIPKR